MVAQYDSLSESYLKFVKLDPCKKFVHYPETKRLLGSIKNKTVLDVGCGAGVLTRIIAGEGAKIIAYDISKEQVALAREKELKDKFGIKYFVSDTKDIEKILTKEIGNELSIDKAFANLVLHYAKDFSHLTQFFKSTFNLLKKGGEFVGIISNPDYKKLNQARYHHLFRRTKTGMESDFLDSSGNVLMTIQFSDFSRKDYENAAKKAGFKLLKWDRIKIDKAGIKKMGSSYWDDFEKDCPYVGFIARK